MIISSMIYLFYYAFPLFLWFLIDSLFVQSRSKEIEDLKNDLSTKQARFSDMEKKYL